MLLHRWPRRLCLFSAALAVALFSRSTAQADVRMPAVFSDHMVLQSGMPVPIWGWAEPAENVTVTIAGQSKSATADSNGQWRLQLDALAPGGPHTLSVQGTNMLVVSDVLVGEVWLGSGQSNMAMTVNRAANFSAEQAAADLPQIRMFKVGQAAAQEPQTDCQGSWLVCSPENVGSFSATAYFFGRALHRELRVPVGLINSSVGGTPIESWIRPAAQRESKPLEPLLAVLQDENRNFDEATATAKYERDLARWKEKAAEARREKKSVPRAPQNPVAVRKRKGDLGGLFNGMIAPLIPYAIRGAIWYQGEANTVPTRAPYYRYQLPLLVRDWRTRWNQGEFPFAWVQLPNFRAADRDWPLVREAMLETLTVPNTGMAITIDIGDPQNIHPQNKQDVGQRLAQWALGAVYGKPVAVSGPLPLAYDVEATLVRVRFRHADGGLVAKGESLRGFEICGPQGNWQAAEARIEGDAVIVSHPDAAQPVAVRYAWADNPDANLYNSAGLPASPFRTRGGESESRESNREATP